MMRQVCLDASVWIKVLTEEPGSLQAQRLVARLIRERTDVVAPSIMRIEVGSILRKKWSRKLLSRDQLDALWRNFNAMPIRYMDDYRLHEKAWNIAEANGLVHLYDAVYLALAEQLEFWTADARLVRSVARSVADVRLLEVDA